MQVKIRNPHTMRWQTTALALLLAGSGCLDHADGDLSTAHSRAAALTPPQGIDVSGDQGGVVTYTYDGSGRRVLKEYAPASDGVRAVYAVGRHLDVVEREDGSLAMERYVLIGGRRAVYIPDDADGEIYHLHSDVLGSPRWITNSSGGLVRHLRYEPFGRSLDDDPPLRYRHAGEEVSERLTHLGGIRQYNSAIGRMMQPDSLIPDPANPQSLNRYTYAYNEPMAYVDPSGRFPLLPAILVVIGLFFIENDVDANIAPSVTAGLGGAALATPLRAVAVGSAVETGADTVQAIGLGIDAAVTGDPNTAVEAGVAALDALSGLPTDQAEQATARRLARGQEEASSGGAAGAAGTCFVAGTQVWTDDGLAPIEEIEAGDFVACAQAGFAEWSSCEVQERLEHHHVGGLVSITADRQSVEATGNHPFWVVSGDGLEFRPVATDAGADAFAGDEDGRWVEARDVEVDDRVLLADGRQVRVESVSFSSGSLPVFNLRVAGHQTYAVGEAGVLVHNKANVYKPPRVLQSGGNTIKKSTAKALGLEPRVARDAMHKMKPDILAEARDTGKIMSNGDYVHKDTGEVLGNIFDYVPGNR